MPIRVLPQTLINQIAAGEVVVRMASAVKELVENSIDAGATRIEVVLGNEGRDCEVRDDGCGMGRDDAEMSLQRHATSKIASLEDLMAVRTRGFRGEAVPSIASVSRMEIQTREHGALAGTRIVVEGGRIERIEAVGCPPGTRMIVRDLFFNTPARRKFLKSPSAETNAVLATVTRQAIAQHRIGWRVERDGDVLLDVPPAQSLAERFAAILGSNLRRPLIPFGLERDDVRASGLIAHPDDARGDRRHQYLFLNARPFGSRAIAASLEQACKGFTMVGRFPIACVFVDVPAGDVDINVHPTKEEVRFRDERHVAGTVFHAVQAALGGAPALIGEIASSEAPQPAPPTFGIAPPPFFTSPEALVRRAFDRKQERQFQQPDALVEAARTAAPAPRTAVALPASRHADGTAISAGPGEVPDAAFWSRALEAEPLGQIAETYIVARFGEDLILVDQHAAHERLRYLELLRRGSDAGAQEMLIPLTVDVTPAQAEAIRGLVPGLAALGIAIEEFGPRTWAVRSLPADLPELDAVPMLMELIDDLADAKRTNALDSLRDRILIRAACHSAIRAGQQLALNEMAALLAQMRQERLSLTCPHGRPTVVRLAKAELDRQFKRI